MKNPLHFYPNSVYFVRSGYWIPLLTWALITIYIAPRFGGSYTPDSYAYAIIGRNIFSGFGFATQAIRDFYLEVSSEFYLPTRSFPPLTPILIGGFDRIFHKGITSGIYVNLVVLLGLFHAHYVLCRRLVDKYVAIVFLSLPLFILVTDSPDSFVAEIVAGRSIPLSALLFTLIAIILIADDLTPLKSGIAGVLTGLLYLNRYDSLIFCFALLIFVFLSGRQRAHAFFIGFALVLTPWLIRNAVTFGSFFASDNAVTVRSIHPGIVQISWFFDVPELRDNPSVWAAQRVKYLLRNIDTLTVLLRPFGGLVPVLLAILGICSGLVSEKVRSFFILSFVWVVAHLLAVSTTPYFDHRYFSFSAFLIALCSTITICSVVTTIKGHQGHVSQPPDLSLKVLLVFRSVGALLLFLTIVTTKGIVDPSLRTSDQNAEMNRCIYNAFKEVIGSSHLVAYRSPESLAFYSDWKTIYLPLNLVVLDQDFIGWSEHWRVTHIIVPETVDIPSSQLASIVNKGCGVKLLELRHASELD